jgi:hypothetical protein
VACCWRSSRPQLLRPQVLLPQSGSRFGGGPKMVNPVRTRTGPEPGGVSTRRCPLNPNARARSSHPHPHSHSSLACRILDSSLSHDRHFSSPLVAPQVLRPKTRGSLKPHWPTPQTRATSRFPLAHVAHVVLDPSQVWNSGTCISWGGIGLFVRSVFFFSF